MGTQDDAKAHADPAVMQVMEVVTQGFRLVTEHMTGQDKRLEALENQVQTLARVQEEQGETMQKMAKQMSVPDKARYAHQRVNADGKMRREVASELGVTPARVSQYLGMHRRRVGRSS